MVSVTKVVTGKSSRETLVSGHTNKITRSRIAAKSFISRFIIVA